MGVSIKWAPVGPGKDITPGNRSTFQSALGDAFGEGRDWLLNSQALELLSGMMVGFKAVGDEGSRQACRKLYEAIQEHGSIRVWCEW